MEKTVLVVARKFNDIFYAVNCEEFKKAKRKHLLIIAQNDNQLYPYTDLFDEIFKIESADVSWRGQIKLLSKILQLKNKLYCDILFTSNLVLLSHLFVVKISGCKSIILLEDGYMNYRSDNFDVNRIKNLVLRILGINKKRIFDNIKITYLLDPNEAKYCFGMKKKILLNPSHTPVYIGPDLSNKNIFIGQALYATDPNVSFKTYNEIVNRIIKEYKIDYYIPHFYASQEKIDCPVLNLSEYGVTLEMISNIFKFNIFSFSSSLLFTTRLINPEINSIMVSHNDIPEIVDKDIFVKSGVIISHLN